MEKEISKYKESYKRIWWINQSTITKKLVRKVVESILIRKDNFSVNDFNALISMTAHVKTIGPLKKIEIITLLDINSISKKEILSLITSDVGCWGLPRQEFSDAFSNKEYLHAFKNLLKTLVFTESENTETLFMALKKFAKYEIPILQSAFISPILYCIHPIVFPIVNRKSREVIGDYYQRKFSHKLIDYLNEREFFVKFRKDNNFLSDFRDVDGYVVWMSGL